MKMALLPAYKYFCFNGEILPVDQFVAAENEGGIYEVLRVVHGVPLFLEEHLQRFYNSAKLAGKPIGYTPGQIHWFLKQLIEKDGVESGNILLSCKANLKAFFIAHNYPTIEQYKQGVKCGVLHAERANPNVKVFQTSVRQMANKLITDHAFYEVLLIDRKGRVTEGSRTNVFFVKEDKIYTPKANKVLLGITRQKTLECARQLGLKIKEKNVEYCHLKDFDAIFLTGTSPKILPVSNVEDFSFEVKNEILQQFMKKYDLMIGEYIKRGCIKS